MIRKSTVAIVDNDLEVTTQEARMINDSEYEINQTIAIQIFSNCMLHNTFAAKWRERQYVRVGDGKATRAIIYKHNHSRIWQSVEDREPPHDQVGVPIVIDVSEKSGIGSPGTAQLSWQSIIHRNQAGNRSHVGHDRESGGAVIEH